MIHYHGSPCSGPADPVGRFYAGRHAMVSFAHPDQMDIIAEACQSFALDNGAFSAWRSGKPLDVDGFAEWVQEWKRHPGFDWHLVPDVIDGTERDNDALLYGWMTRAEVQDAEPVPVWHLHESIGRLQRLAAHSRRVALGSSGEYATPGTDQWDERMKEALAAICFDGRPVCKLHGLRMLSRHIFPRFPLASADSTNAPQNAGRPVGNLAFAWQRANFLADGIEACNSSPLFVRGAKQLDLFAG